MKTYLITGGAGFIGTNYAARLLQRGEKVIVYDSLTRRGTANNIDWLRANRGSGELEFVRGDVTDRKRLECSVAHCDVIVHLAAQVAVTASVQNPRDDFATNAIGTFNVLEAARAREPHPIVLYASTNKVYGDMPGTGIDEGETRYHYSAHPNGIDEHQPLDFHSPYGCSKGCGDQYTRDYHRIYGLPTVVFRQSCIYGPHQHGVEDQGWLAWFMLAAMSGRQISIFGDGKQVRDVLHVEDLLDAYDRAVARIDVAAGEVFNTGGGPARSLSVWSEFGPLLEKLSGREIAVHCADWRPGDQRIYISNIGKLKSLLGWEPAITVGDGLADLFCWVEQHLGECR